MLTLEERERIAYITNSPDHALIVEALEGDEAVRADLQLAEERANEEEKRADRTQGDLEDAETKVADLEEKLGFADDMNNELRAQIHAAGVDLV